MRKLVSLLVIAIILFTSVSCSNKNVLDNDAKNIKPNTNNINLKTRNSNSMANAKTETKTPKITPQTKNSVSNIRNGGLVAIQGDHILYINLSDESKLYSMKLDGSNRVKITDYKVSGYLNVVGDWVYFLNTNLCRIKISEPNMIEVVDKPASLNGIIHNCFIVDEGVYTVTSNVVNNKTIYGIYRMKLDGTDKKKIFESNTFILVGADSDWIYLLKKGGTYKIKLDGSKETKVSEQVCLTLSDGYLYSNRYKSGNSVENGIFRLKTDGTLDNKILHSNIIGSINISGDWVLFEDAKTNKLYKAKVNGEQKTVLATDCHGFINTAGDWIFYWSTKNNLFGAPKLGIIKMD